ncbi:MAG: response regulator [Nitrospirae bacterium]|nr:response regulator [Nitrospirota bacterium]
MDNYPTEAKRILVVEDEIVTAMDLKSNLVNLGYEVYEIASNGNDAIRMANEFRPDLVLMDIRLNGPMSGIEAAEEIRKSCSIPIVYMTAHTDVETIEKAKITEPFGYITKPCDNSTLMSTIEVALYKSESDARRRKAEKALEESEARYRRITEGLTDYQYSVRIENGRAVETKHSAACAALTGYTAEEFAADPYLWISMVVDEDRDLIIKRVEQILAGRDIQPIEHRLIRKDGALRWVRDNIIIYKDPSGRLMSYDGVVKDITERKKLEEQLLQSQKMEAIGVLAGGVAHDFNNILMSVIGYGTMAKKRLKDDAETKEFVEEMLAGANRAAELTRGLLAFSRKQVIIPKENNLNVIVKNLERTLRRIMGEGIELKTVFIDRDIMVKVDEGQIDKVLLNLATNASDAMPDGGYLIIGTDMVNIDDSYSEANLFENKGWHAVLTVSDTGRGMDLKTRQNIFEPFFTTKGIGKATGLGLAMAYGIIKQHGGNITVDSELGKGTTFRIYLPMM